MTITIFESQFMRLPQDIRFVGRAYRGPPNEVPSHRREMEWPALTRMEKRRAAQKTLLS